MKRTAQPWDDATQLPAWLKVFLIYHRLTLEAWLLIASWERGNGAQDFSPWCSKKLCLSQSSFFCLVLKFSFSFSLSVQGCLLQSAFLCDRAGLDFAELSEGWRHFIQMPESQLNWRKSPVMPGLNLSFMNSSYCLWPYVRFRLWPPAISLFFLKMEQTFRILPLRWTL